MKLSSPLSSLIQCHVSTFNAYKTPLKLALQPVAECSGGEARLRPSWPLLGAVTHDTPVGWQWWRKETCESVRQSKRNKWSVGSYSYRPSLCFNTTLRRCLLQGLTKCIKPSAEGGPQVPSESNRLKSTLEFKICQPATKTRLLIVEDPSIPNFPNVKSL
jgi:hypothetical protein